MGQKLYTRSLLVFDTLQIVAFRFVCFFVCLFVLLQKSHICFRGLEKVQGGCMHWCECCMGHYESIFRFAGFGFSDPAALLFLSLGTRSPPAHRMHPCPTSGLDVS